MQANLDNNSLSLAPAPSVLHDEVGEPRTSSQYVADRLAGEPRHGNPTNFPATLGGNAASGSSKGDSTKASGRKSALDDDLEALLNPMLASNVKPMSHMNPLGGGNNNTSAMGGGAALASKYGAPASGPDGAGGGKYGVASSAMNSNPPDAMGGSRYNF